MSAFAPCFENCCVFGQTLWVIISIAEWKGSTYSYLSTFLVAQTFRVNG